MSSPRLGTDDAIAIVGMGCRFPGGAANPEAFWDLVRNGVDATTEVPEERWSLRRFYDADPAAPGKTHAHRGGFLRESIRGFDAAFFGISPREAAPMDPQQRLLLEVVWEALEDAGIVPATLRGSRTGVYVGGFTLDNKLHLLNTLNREAIGTHTALSATLGMLANRLSHVFDLRGPSLTVDTACSSSLVALHLAIQALRQAECELALVGGVNVMFRPAYSIAMAKGGFLSADGRSKSFDARGDGYGRGEGAGIVVLKPLRAALADGDPVRAVVLATGVNQDGRTAGITLPNADAQTELVRAVCEQAGVAPGEIGYVEAHGTGTVAGDAAEARSLSAAVASSRPASAGPLPIGSAKSNLGHLEAAAGVAGLIKAALALEKRAIPPSVHFREAPADLDLGALRLEVPTRLRPWSQPQGRRLAAVNSFGYGGTNAHALLAEPPAPAPTVAREPDRPLILPVSARSDASLVRRLRALHQVVAARRRPTLVDLGYTLARRRTHHDHRAAIVAGSLDELREHLRHFLSTGERRHGFVPALEHRQAPRLAFVYTGMGPQSWGMGAELVDGEPLAAAALARCDDVWQPLAGWSLATLFADRSGRPMSEPRHAQPANFVLQVILTELLRAYGLEPAAVVGHSTGEIAAAWASGALDLPAAVTLTWHRSRLQQTLLGTGGMLAVGLSREELGPDLPPGVEVAAINGPRSVTLAGPGKALDALAEELAAKEAFHRRLAVEVPYHGAAMDDVREPFLEGVAGLGATAPEHPLYSSVTGERIDGIRHDATYWWRNLRQPVRFASALTAMAGDGHDLFLEIGPHPVLAPAIRDGAAAAGAPAECLTTLRRGEPERTSVAGAAAAAFVRGVDLDWPRSYPAGKPVRLPSYPWHREELWTESLLSRADRLGSREHPILARRQDEAVPVWEGDLSRSFHRYLEDHRVEGEPVFPAAGHLELALAVRTDRAASAVIEELVVHRPLETFATPKLRLHLDEDGGRFSIHARAPVPDAPWRLHATGRMPPTPIGPRRRSLDHEGCARRSLEAFDAGEFYSSATRLGLEYGPAFRCIREGRIGTEEALLRLELAPIEAAEADEYHVHPVLLDGALQAALALELAREPTRATLSLPIGVAECRFHRRGGTSAWCHAVRGAGGLELTLFDDAGEPLAELFGLATRALPLDTSPARRRGEWLYVDRWQAQPAAPPSAPSPRRWLVFADAGGVAEELARRGGETAVSCLLVEAADRQGRPGGDGFQVRRGSRDDFDRLLAELRETDLDGVLYLWGLDLPDGTAGSEERTTGRDDVVDLLHLAQALDAGDPARGRPVPLVVCTAGTQTVTGTDGGASPGQRTLWGAVRSVRRERPERRFQLIDLATRMPFVAATHLLAEMRIPIEESEIAYRGSTRYVDRVAKWGRERYRERRSTPETAWCYGALVQGGTHRRGFVETVRRAPADGEVEVAIATAALGEETRQRLRSLEAAEIPALALQCTGRITALGRGVDHLHEGQPVLVLEPVAELAAYRVVPADSVLPYPEGVDADDGGAVFDRLDAAYALFEIARLGAGQSVLVHRAETGLGLAAVDWARGTGAVVYVTTSVPEHREALVARGAVPVGDTTDLAFRDAVREATGGAGVDVVISPLLGEWRAASLDLVREGGVFVDVSPADRARTEQVPLRFAEAGIRLARPDRARARHRDAEGMRRAWTRVACAPPRAAPPPVTEYHAPAVEEAFEACLRGGRIGRLVVAVDRQIVPIAARRPRPPIDPEASYLVTGGFGGLGLETVRWLCARGARHVAVLSRSGPASVEAREVVAALSAAGARVEHESVDIGDRAALDRALTRLAARMPTLRGVIHGAAVLADGALETLGSEHVDRAMGAKALGALNLHLALEDVPLDFFVCHSSVAASLGNAGQLAYAAANAFLDGLVAYRRSRGLRATSIRWGPIAETGMAARDPRVLERLAGAGLSPLPPSDLFAILEEALVEGWSSFDAVDVSWPAWVRLAAEPERRRYADLATADPHGGENGPEALRRRVLALEAGQRRGFLFALVAGVVADVARMTESRIDPSHRLPELGADSIMTAEVAQAIAERTGVRLRMIYLATGPTLGEVTATIEETILDGLG